MQFKCLSSHQSFCVMHENDVMSEYSNNNNDQYNIIGNNNSNAKIIYM